MGIEEVVVRMGAIGDALALAGSMTWEVLWALILGFALAAVVQAVVRKSEIVRLMGDDRPRTLAVAAGLGAASSSCSYAAVDMSIHAAAPVWRRLRSPGASTAVSHIFVSEWAAVIRDIALGLLIAGA